MTRFNPSKEAAKQVGGTHYSKHEIQPLHIIDEYGLDYYRGNAIKYILRNKMDPYEDIEKAIHYLELWLDRNKDLKKVKETGKVPHSARKAYFEDTGMYSDDDTIIKWVLQGEL